MMRLPSMATCIAAGVVLVTVASAQQNSEIQLKIEPSNRTLTVSAEERVTADPELAIVHIGFQTQPSDAKTAYVAGAKISNDIVIALKQAGITESVIRSKSQHLDSFDYKAHKFRLVQQWTVKTPPERAAEILDIAISAGATQSGEIDWTVKDERALEEKALEQAAARANAKAAVLAKGMGVHLGALMYVTDQVSKSEPFALNGRNFALNELKDKAAAPQALAIEPRKVSRIATVYAVFAIE